MRSFVAVAILPKWCVILILILFIFRSTLYIRYHSTILVMYTYMKAGSPEPGLFHFYALSPSKITNCRPLVKKKKKKK